MNAEKQLEEIYDTLGKEFVLNLMANTKRAMQKHPNFTTNAQESHDVFMEEVFEVKQAFYTETLERTKEELLDVATVCSRWYNAE